MAEWYRKSMAVLNNSLCSSNSEVLAMSGATVSTTNLVPAGAKLVGVTCKVLTAVTSGDGGTDMLIGDGSDANRFGDTIAFAAGTLVGSADYTANPEGWSAATQDVTITCAASGVATAETFSGGSVKVTAYYTMISE